MEKTNPEKRSKQKRKKQSRNSILLNCFTCTSPRYESDDPDLCLQLPELQSTTSILHVKPQVSVTHHQTCNSRTSSFFILEPKTNPQNTQKNVQLSQIYSEKIENKSPNKNLEKTSHSPPSFLVNEKIKNKEEKDEAVKAILQKYLAVKREERLNKRSNSDDDKKCSKSPRAQSDFIKVECASTDSVETVFLGDSPKKPKKDAKPKAEFPIKNRSAPTNSIAHDSLADICSKMSRYKQQETKSSNTYITFSEENTAPKKKLELIFKESDISCIGDNSTVCLHYAISCEGAPVATGILRTDSEVLQKSKGERNDGDVKKHKTRKSSQEVDSAAGEFSGIDESNHASLKWKLVISQHGRGDVS